MQGKQVVIDALNELLAGELTAMDQHFIHSEMYADWGLTRLYERIAHEFDDEKGHAKAIIERILFLGGTPDLSKRAPLRVGRTVPEMLQNDLDTEYEVARNLKRVIALCEQEQDYQTREMLCQQLADTEEDHAYWLEKQLGLIDRMGLENYLQPRPRPGLCITGPGSGSEGGNQPVYQCPGQGRYHNAARDPFTDYDKYERCRDGQGAAVRREGHQPRQRQGQQGGDGGGAYAGQDPGGGFGQGAVFARVLSQWQPAEQEGGYSGQQDRQVKFPVHALRSGRLAAAPASMPRTRA
jgi:bacterioferritin